MVTNRLKMDFIIIGGQKTGSTFIHSILAKHPEVYTPMMEVPYLESPDYENGGLLKLKELFEGQDSTRLWGIKRPNYLYNSIVTKRIKEHFPNTKLIICLRNPYQRFLSAYYHNINYGFLGAYSLNKGISMIINNNLPNKYKRAYEVLEFSKYSTHIKNYLDLFPKNNTLILNFDDLKNGNKIKYIKQIYKFLNIEENFIPPNLNTKPQAVIYSIPRLRFLKLRNHFLYNYNTERTRLELKKQSIFDKIAIKLIEFTDRKLLCKLYTTSRPNIEFPKRLTEILNLDIERLENILSKDLSEWKI